MVYTNRRFSGCKNCEKSGNECSNFRRLSQAFTRKLKMYRRINDFMGSIIKILVKCLYNCLECGCHRVVTGVVTEVVTLRLSLKKASISYL